jgi:hypothetical protein
MLDSPPLDPMGSLVTEVRGKAYVAALVGTRVRGGEPGAGDAKGPEAYQAFVVFRTLSEPPERRVPITFAEYGVEAYGVTYQNARAVWGAVVQALHEVGPRIKSNGLLIYKTAVITGGTQDKDPDTGQPLYRGTVRLIAALQSVTA